MTDYVLEQPADRLLWGYGRVIDHVDLYDEINALVAKYDVENADVSAEIKSLSAKLEDQKQLLQTLVDEEIESVKAIGQELTN